MRVLRHARRRGRNHAAEERLHVVPALEMTVCVDARVELDDLDLAAVTQQRIADALAALIDGTWRAREIGRQIELSELYQAVKTT